MQVHRFRSRAAAALLAATLPLAAGPAALAAHRPDLPAGARIPVRFETTVSSATSRPEDRVVAVVREDVRSGGRVVIPEGSELRGHVVTAVPSGRVKGRARLAVRFDTLVIGGRSHRIATQRIDITAPSGARKDARILVGTTAAGTVIGALAGGKKGAKKGAILGAGAGAGTVLVTKGKEVTLPAGTRWRVALTRGLDL